VYYRNEMGLFVRVVDDEEEFAHELNELLEFYKLFLEVLFLVVMRLNNMFEQYFLFIKNR
jgi:hypothetical protein